MTPGWAKQKLSQIHRAATHVSTNQICIHRFQRRGQEYPACENAIAESRCEAFDLALKPAQHIERGAIRNVTVGPCRMPAVGCA